MFSSYFSVEDCRALTSPVHGDVQGVYDKFQELQRSLYRRMRDHSWDIHPHWNRGETISDYSLACAGQFNGLAMPFTRSREQAVLVERLMGTRAEARFAFISDKAEFASEDLLDV